MEKFKAGEMTVEAGTQILTEGSGSSQLYTVLSGMGMRTKQLSNGRRQVISFVFPGDLIGLQASLMSEMEHSVDAASRMRLCVFNRSELYQVFKSHPDRAFDLTWLVSSEEHFLGEALTTVGQRSAIERISWAFVKIHQRAAAIDLLEENGLPFPYRQQDLADALGLSLVHTNKTLAKLRERQLVFWSEGTLRVTKLEELARIAGMEIGPLRQRPLM
ncbi:Crp/Fnr family transcriptional regulator [Profundibacterium mesophilum]|nr:Crp/Fnr family transcriptional regulator [Profundibacterium mesophilum]